MAAAARLLASRASPTPRARSSCPSDERDRDERDRYSRAQQQAARETALRGSVSVSSLMAKAVLRDDPRGERREQRHSDRRRHSRRARSGINGHDVRPEHGGEQHRCGQVRALPGAAHPWVTPYATVRKYEVEGSVFRCDVLEPVRKQPRTLVGLALGHSTCPTRRAALPLTEATRVAANYWCRCRGLPGCPARRLAVA
jgi:hypothetical protein